jgi:nicotinamidase-related amidase
VSTKPKPVPALVVVDMQNELLDDAETPVPRAAEVIERIARRRL